MDTGPSKGKDEGPAQPEAEVLTTRSGDNSGIADSTTTPLQTSSKDGKPQHRRLYRPSHRATFVGLAAVAAILLVNAIIIGLVIRSQSNSNSPPQGQVTVSQDALDKLGVNRDSLDTSGIVLTVTPNTQFKGKVVVGGDITVAGQFQLNSKLSASDANFTQLEAGNTTLDQLNVNGDGTVTNLNTRSGLNVTGTTRLQGPVTLSSLLTINNGANIAGNLTVGSSISSSTISGSTLTAISTLTIGGHIITTGSAPVITAHAGSSVLGSNGSVSISGNDASGTLAFNVGVGASQVGMIASIAFHTGYDNTPHVVITPIGDVGYFHISRSGSGFTIYIDGPGPLAPGGYAFDYIVEE
jgi:cytoskeletal protein CcmA (bactofilin family)